MSHTAQSRRWSLYREHFLDGLWHVHTPRTDGRSDVADYVEVARELGIDFIAFTEHVAETLTYSFEEFAEEIGRQRKSFDGTLLVGAEARIVDSSGRLAIPDSIVPQLDFLFCAVHRRFFDTADEFISGVTAALARPEVDAWAHPLGCLDRCNLVLDDNQLDRLAAAVIDSGVAIELNLQYGPPPGEFLQRLPAVVPRIVGLDAHSVDHVRSRWPMIPALLAETSRHTPHPLTR